MAAAWRMEHGENGRWSVLYVLTTISILTLNLLGTSIARADQGLSITAATPEYTKRLWRVQDGLSEGTVQALAQGQEGYLWVGTTGGLARFDGSKFSVLREDVPKTQEGAQSRFLIPSEGSLPKTLQTASVFCILPGHDGSLWLGSEGSGLLHYVQGRIQAYGSPQGLTDGFVRSLLEDDTGRLWIGTDNGLFQKDGSRPGRIRRVDVLSSMRPLAVHAIAEDNEHRVWVGGSQLVVIDHGTVRSEKLPGAYSQNRVKSILQTTDGAVWVGTVGGLNRLEHRNFVPVAGINGTVRVLRETADRTLWIGTIGHGLWTWRDGRLQRIDADGLLPSKTVLSISEDRSRQVWIGTQAGMVCLSRTPVHVLALPGGSESDFGTISRDGDNGLWVVSSTVFEVRNGIAHPYSFPQLGTTPVRNVFRDRAGQFWVGTDGSGAFHLTPRGAVHYSAPKELPNNFVRAFLEGRDGDI